MELVQDFPFINESERACALSPLFLPFIRNLIDGATPLHLFEKPTPGTGATLLVEMLLYVALARAVAAMAEGRDENEVRKLITATLKSGSQVIFIDNLARRLDSPAIASAITSPTWEDRILGASQMVRLPVKCVWVATGNNPAVSSEIARRCVRIRMDAKKDRPWMRTDFKHPDLRGWVRENRTELVWSVLTIVQAWIAAGRPPGKVTLGNFDSWAKTLGGIFENAGIKGFLGNLNEFYSRSDEEGVAQRAFLAAWWEEHEQAPLLTSQLIGFAEDAGLTLGQGDQKVRLGLKLRELRDRTFCVALAAGGEVELRIDEAGKRSGAKLWQIRRVDDAPTLSA